MNGPDDVPAAGRETTATGPGNDEQGQQCVARLTIKRSALRGPGSRYWAAVNSLVQAALQAESKAAEEGEKPNGEEEDDDLEEGEVRIDKTEEMTAEAEDEDVEVQFFKDFIIDPSGSWTSAINQDPMAERMTAVDYLRDAETSILGTDFRIKDVEGRRTPGRRQGGCYNCGSFEHNMNQCPEPLDRRRIAEARDEQERSGMRYHESSAKSSSLAHKYPHVKVGSLSEALRRALGLSASDPDPFERVRQRLGQPVFRASGQKSAIEEEPLLKLIDDATTAEASDESTSKNESTKQATLGGSDFPYPNCKETGSDSWRRRLLPACTCGTDLPCLRLEPNVPPAQFTDPPTPSPLLQNRTPVNNEYSGYKRGRDNLERESNSVKRYRGRSRGRRERSRSPRRLSREAYADGMYDQLPYHDASSFNGYPPQGPPPGQNPYGYGAPPPPALIPPVQPPPPYPMNYPQSAPPMPMPGYGYDQQQAIHYSQQLPFHPSGGWNPPPPQPQPLPQHHPHYPSSHPPHHPPAYYG